MNTPEILRKACYAGIGALEFSREQLSDARKTLKESLDDFVERGERLNEREDSLAGALFAALKITPKVPTAEDADNIIAGYDDLTVTDIVDQMKSLSTRQLEIIREYEYHNRNRIRIIRQIDRELDEVRIIPDYDNLTVGDVVKHLDGLSPQQLAAIRDYERNHRKRATILKAIERRLAEVA